MKIENLLRNEKEQIAQQCSLVFVQNRDYSLHMPMPATRLTVHNQCEYEMRKIANAIFELNVRRKKSLREISRRKESCHRSSSSYIKTAPTSLKGWKLCKHQISVTRIQVENEIENMLYEDDLSRLVGKYHAVKLRKVDYDRYYILALRYGIVDEVEFHRDKRPGYRYFNTVTVAAVHIQKLN